MILTYQVGVLFTKSQRWLSFQHKPKISLRLSWTKWTSYHRRNFQVYFLEWQILYFDPNSRGNCNFGPINSKSSMIQVMVWRRIGDKPLPEPMLARFIGCCGIEAFSCHPSILQHLRYDIADKKLIHTQSLRTYTLKNIAFIAAFWATQS